MEILSLRSMKMMMIMMIMMTTTMAEPELHYVGGGKTGWIPRINLSEWSKHEHFKVHDWLYFGHDTNMYNVLEVNKSSYENCIESGFINNITKGGRDVFELKEAKPYYFLSGRGHCWEGLKVEINVLNDAQPSPSPLPPSSASSISSHFCGIQVVLLSAMFWSIMSPVLEHVSY